VGFIKQNRFSQHTSCPSCKAVDLKLVTDTVRFERKASIYHCNKCDLTFLDQNSYKFPQDFYRAEYHQTYLTHIEPDADQPKKYFNKMKKATKIWADRFRTMLKGNETVLDVGCSSGHFIKLIQDKTRSVYGCELNKKEIEFCKKELDLDVSDEEPRKRFPSLKFDYITCIFVLEHIGQPVKFLKSLKALLKPHGKIIAVVPSLQDPLISLYDIPEFKKFYFCVEHLYYYNQITINNVFRKAGLNGVIESIQEYPLNNHMFWLYQKRAADVLRSRQVIPQAKFAKHSTARAWQAMWQDFNSQYQEFLTDHGFGDRLWCVMGKL